MVGAIRYTSAATYQAVEVMARSAAETSWLSLWLYSLSRLWCGGEWVLSSSEETDHPRFMPPTGWGRSSSMMGGGE